MSQLAIELLKILDKNNNVRSNSLLSENKQISYTLKSEQVKIVVTQQELNLLSKIRLSK